MSDDAVFFPGLHYTPVTFCKIRGETIAADELHMHSTTPEGKLRCDKIINIGIEPTRADLFKEFALALMAGDEERAREISEQLNPLRKLNEFAFGDGDGTYSWLEK